MKVKYKVHKDKLITGITAGLLKNNNEDVVSFNVNKSNIKICLCDGHWGDFAAKYVNNYILNTSFPKSFNEAVEFMRAIEHKLWKKLGKEIMDPEQDFTPETGFIAIEKTDNLISILAYGDCRLIIIRNGRVIYRLDTYETWIGAFSYLKLRNRLPIQEALIYKNIACKHGDIVMLYSDGIDECRYNMQTLSSEWLVHQINSSIDLKSIANNIFEGVKNHGAEDNASLALVAI